MDTGDWHETKQFIRNRAISNKQNKYFILWTYKNFPNIHHKNKNNKNQIITNLTAKGLRK